MKLISLDGIKTFLAKLNSLVVHKAGTETITGAKTFSDGITSTKIKSDSIVTGLKGTHYFQCRKFRGEGDASTYYHAIDFGFSGHNQVDFHEYGGTWNFYMNQDGLSTSGTLVGSIQPDGWHGNVIGNASSATKATQDGSGNVIIDTYATKASVPTKVSQLTNDSGYLTSHQDLSAYAKKTDIPSVPVKGVKVDGSTSKLTPDSSGVVTIPAIPTAVSSFTNDAGYLTAHQDISGKADKSTTLAGYGITDAYTSTEVDSKIKAAIGAIADYDSTAF